MRPFFLASVLAVLAACSTEPSRAARGPASSTRAARAPWLPSAASLLDGHVAATGGRAAYEKLTSRVSTGRFTADARGRSGRFTMVQLAPDRMYLSVEMPGVGKEERGTDGRVAWSRSAMTGTRILDGGERAQLLRSAALQSAIRWAEQYVAAETVGRATVDGRDAYEVALRTPEGTIERRSYDAATHLLLRTSAVERSPMGEVPVDTVFSDYRTAGELLVAHRSIVEAMSMEQVLTLERVDTNVPVDPKLFQVPADLLRAARPPG